MTAAEATVKKGGVVIMLAKSNDGHGGESFYRLFTDEPDVDKAMQLCLERGRNETIPDQWQAQILLRILQKASVIYVSDADDALIRDLHMIPAHSIDEAISIAKDVLKNTKPSIIAIPDGIAVTVVDN